MSNGNKLSRTTIASPKPCCTISNLLSIHKYRTAGYRFRVSITKSAKSSLFERQSCLNLPVECISEILDQLRQNKNMLFLFRAFVQGKHNILNHHDNVFSPRNFWSTSSPAKTLYGNHPRLTNTPEVDHLWDGRLEARLQSSGSARFSDP